MDGPLLVTICIQHNDFPDKIQSKHNASAFARKATKSLQQEDELETNCRAMNQTSKPEHRIMRYELMQSSFKNHIRQ